MSRRERQRSTNLSTKSVTEGATTKHELEHKKCHGGSTKSVTEEATTKHELEHKKCHGGSDQKAQTGAQKVSRREGPKSGNLSTKSHGGSDQLAKVLYRQGGTITESNRVMLGAIFGAIFCGFSL